MTLRLANRWVWDFRAARECADYHIFYLQAPRDLVEQELRHWNASVGHAVSRDLRDWRVLPGALHPGPEEAWDDGAIWTGSVDEHNGTWHMLYTGINKREKQEGVDHPAHREEQSCVASRRELGRTPTSKMPRRCTRSSSIGSARCSRVRSR